jgi:hypothetical protein
MAKHEAGYARVERDFYPTPPWVVSDALAEHVDLRGLIVWEVEHRDGVRGRDDDGDGGEK